MPDYQVDDELLNGFIDESMEGLEPVDAFLISLEKNPDDIETVNKIFRPFHSIKGSAAFFGLMKVKILAHRMEDILDRIRQNKKAPDAIVINLLLNGLDRLRTIFSGIKNGETEDSGAGEDFESFIERLSQAIKETDEGTVSKAAVFLCDLIFKLEEIRTSDFSDKGKLIDEAESIITKITPLALGEMYKTADKNLENTPATKFLKLFENKFEDLVKDEKKVSSIKQELINLKDMSDSPDTSETINKALSEYESFMKNIGFDEILYDSLKVKALELQEKGKWKINPDQPQNSVKPKKDVSKKLPEKKDPKERTMRVLEKDIDSFLSFVSELVVVEEMFNYLHKKLSRENTHTASEFKRVIETFGTLSGNMRKSIFSIRRVPVKSLLSRAERIVHDVCAANGKKAEVIIEGDEMTIDKSYLELLDAPFTHMIRNAADHGIESPGERLACNKPEAGRINAVMRETDNMIELEVSDDGGGIDFDAVYSKALELGYVKPGQTLDEDILKDFLFMSGVSTAEQVTEVSGRGVGMDVVRKNVEESGGAIFIDSVKGRGTLFRISLPKNVTTRIMDGFLVRSEGFIYVMPMDMIEESFVFYENEVSSVEGKGRVVKRRNRLYRVLYLSETLMGKEISSPDKKSVEESMPETGIIADCKETSVVVVVDEIIGVQKVVIRNVDGLSSVKELFDGAALLGDGSVAMILGKKGLLALMS